MAGEGEEQLQVSTYVKVDPGKLTWPHGKSPKF